MSERDLIAAWPELGTEPTDIVIDVEELDAAKDDSEWREFCEQADDYVRQASSQERRPS